MIEEASGDLNIDYEHSWMVGDSTSDIELAGRAGLRSVLVATGEGGFDGKWPCKPTIRAADLNDAVTRILQASAPLAFSIVSERATS
jgi:histidinol phosphatase-like enzyme